MIKAVVLGTMIFLNNHATTNAMTVETLPVIDCQKSYHNEYRITVRRGDDLFNYYSFDKPSKDVKVVFYQDKIISELQK